MDTELLTKKVIGCAIEVHKELGPGLLESSYEACLAYELNKEKLFTERQIDLPIKYKDTFIETGYRLDLIIEKRLIVELKSVEKLLPIHSAQLLTYLKLTNISAGLLIIFNSQKLINGIKRLNLHL